MLRRVLATSLPLPSRNASWLQQCSRQSRLLLRSIQSAQSAPLPHGRGCVANDTNEWVREEAAKLPEVPIQLALIHIPGAHPVGLVTATAAAG